jgi:hypothetical protein
MVLSPLSLIDGVLGLRGGGYSWEFFWLGNLVAVDFVGKIGDRRSSEIIDNWVSCGGAIAVLDFLPIGFLCCEMGLKDFVVVVFAVVLDGGDRPSLFIP